ncbi:Clp protease N-terminal domain-containing protein [Devosia sp.]|uniref:Clp protease N-terminal domain-containing protein n=1 Tax=Devosia sp. TaxID=1871048 RepID=UPI002FCA65B0
MFGRLKQNFKDMGTIKTLCEAAERIANGEQQKAPGAEHFVLAALELPDGSAARVFEKLGISGEAFAAALRELHRAALRQAGVSDALIASSERDVPPLPRPNELYNAAPSGEAVLKGLAALRKRGVTGPLIGVHVIEVVLAMQHGATARAFASLGRDPATVMAATQSEMVLAA